MSKRKKRLGLRFYIIFWIFIFVAFTGASSQQYAEYKKYTTEKNAISRELETEKERTAELNRQLRYYESDQYIEQIAREKLGLVRDDEILFYNGSMQKP